MEFRYALGAIMVAGTMVITACVGGSDDATGPSTEPPAVPSTAVDVATTPGPSSEPTTTTGPTDDPFPTYSELADQVADGEIDELTLALSEFSTLFGVDVPGSVSLAVDATLPTLGTDVVQEVRRLDDRLTDEQRAIISARVDEVTGGELVYDTSEDDEYAALFDESIGDDVASTEPQGFGSTQRRQVSEPTTRAISAQAAGTFALTLGGRPLLMEVSVAPEEMAESTTLEALTEFYVIAGIRTCEVTVFDRERNRDGYLISVIAHEVFHCWQHTNASSDTAADMFAGFYKEGLATWVGEQFALGLGYRSGSNFGWIHLRNFFDPTYYYLYRSKYTAYGFWSQVAEIRGGPDALWSIIPELNAVGTDGPAVFALAVDGLDDARRAEIAASALRRPDWSPAWDFAALGVPDDSRSAQNATLRPGRTDRRAVSAGEQAIVEFDLSGLSSETNWIITRANEGLTYNRLGDFDEYPTTAAEQSRYCYGETCVCPDGSSPFSDLIVLPRTVTTLTVALTGAPAEGAAVTLDAADAQDSCDDAPPTTPLASGAFSGNGTWRATNPALATMFADASAFGFGAEPLDIAGVTGDVVMELREDGTGTLTYTNVTAFINNGPLDDLTINGRGDFLFGVADGELTVSGNTFEVSASSGALGGIPIVITDRDIEGGAGGTSSYAIGFDGDQLVLTGAEGSRGAVFFPILWTRV